MKLNVLILSFGILLSSMCFGMGDSRKDPTQDPPVVSTVDLDRYSGLWYEVAHSPNFFQRTCLRSTAEYKVINNTAISVHNTCYKKHSKVSNIDGEASILNNTEPGKLVVQFNTFFKPKGDYWISLLDSDYQWAVVSGPKNKFVFVLSRTESMSHEMRNEILNVMKENNIPTENLIYDQYE